nr:MAG TPA: hypothetical protein [Caudoviricetes sp.]
MVLLPSLTLLSKEPFGTTSDIPFSRSISKPVALRIPSAKAKTACVNSSEAPLNSNKLFLISSRLFFIAFQALSYSFLSAILKSASLSAAF